MLFNVGKVQKCKVQKYRLGGLLDFYFYCGAPPPRPPEIVGLRPPRLTDLQKKSYMNQGGRRQTISGGLGGRAPQ